MTQSTAWWSSQVSPAATLRKHSTSNSGSTSRDTIPCAPRRNNSRVNSSSAPGVTTTIRICGFWRMRSATASTGFGASAPSKITTSEENFFTADCACASVSACPTTRMSSSSAKTLRRPARKMACVSATITRTKWPFAASSPAPRFSSTLTGMLAIESPLRLCPLEAVFVNDHAHTAPAPILEAAHHPAAAVNLHVPPRAHYFGRQHNCEVHHRAHGHVIVHRQQHAVGRDVFCLCRVRPARRLDRCRQMQRKPRRTLQIFELLRVHRFLRHRIPACFPCHAWPFLPHQNSLTLI